MIETMIETMFSAGHVAGYQIGYMDGLKSDGYKDYICHPPSDNCYYASAYRRGYNQGFDQAQNDKTEHDSREVKTNCQS